MGIRVFATDLPGLIAPAARGLYSVIGELVAAGGAEPFAFDATGDEPALLLRDYLTRLLLIFERDHRIVTAPTVREFRRDRLVVSGESFAVDDERSVYYREVKAVTYHELAVRPLPGGLEATIIVDI